MSVNCQGASARESVKCLALGYTAVRSGHGDYGFCFVCGWRAGILMIYTLTARRALNDREIE
jgi:hypothetical protein